jgi:hypothetical protein
MISITIGQHLPPGFFVSIMRSDLSNSTKLKPLLYVVGTTMDAHNSLAVKTISSLSL